MEIVLKQTYCVFCEKVATFFRMTSDFFESVGRARAAAELHKQGYHKEAKYLMTGVSDDD